MSNQEKNLPKISKASYNELANDIINLMETARRQAARSVNAILTATYWEIGRRIVEFEQKGEKRAEYGAAVLKQLSNDLKKRFGRGFSVDNLELMRMFYLSYPPERISESLNRKSALTVNDIQKSESLIRIFFHEEENSPVGLILCAEKDQTVAKYALDGLPNKVLASEYRLALPKEKELAEELTKTRKMLETRQRRQIENASK